MTMDDEMRPLGRPGPDGELERRLESYARARLTPDPARIAGMRVQLLVEARERLEARASVGTAPVVAIRFRRIRLAPMLLAAGLAVFLVGGVAYAGSQAGGPLYGARLWLEDATLPSDPAARLDTELSHLQARLDEAAAGAANGNGAAVQAALDAYRATVDQVVATADGNLDRATHLGLVLARHEAVLSALVTAVPPQATDAIQRAIERTEQKIQYVRGAGNPGSGPSGGPGANPAPGAGGGNPADHQDKNPPGGGPPIDHPGGTSPGGGPDMSSDPGASSANPMKSPKP